MVALVSTISVVAENALCIAPGSTEPERLNASRAAFHCRLARSVIAGVRIVLVAIGLATATPGISILAADLRDNVQIENHTRWAVLMTLLDQNIAQVSLSNIRSYRYTVGSGHEGIAVCGAVELAGVEDARIHFLSFYERDAQGDVKLLDGPFFGQLGTAGGLDTPIDLCTTVEDYTRHDAEPRLAPPP